MPHNPYAPPVETPGAAPTQPYSPGEQVILQPHRGATVLTLGIVGLFLMSACFFGFATGIPAWVMGRRDLNMMHAGMMDPQGHGLTRAGKICGQTATIISLIVLTGYLVAGLVAVLTEH